MREEGRLAELMSRYQRGDRQALAALYQEVAPGMINYLYGWTRNRSFAEDVLQEVFLRVHGARHTYLPGRPVRPWLYAIARHVAIDSMRKRRREVPVADKELEAAVAPAARDDLPDFAQALDGLPAGQREALLLTKVSGLSTREAAAALRTTEGALKVRVHRALKVLRRLLKTTPVEEQGDER